MPNQRTIATLRDHLFKQIEDLSDSSKEVNIERARMIADLSQTVINSLKVEVDYAKIMKGALEVQFIEAEAKERPNSENVEYANSPALPSPSPVPPPPKTSEERMEAALHSGPPNDHPWRGLGGRVHRLQH